MSDFDGFKFQKFVVEHSKCAMKVGTDGVLLGAWVDVNDKKKVLDIGTGSGLIAMMIAQRNEVCYIDAIDIDPQAVLQASENVCNSYFRDRIKVFSFDFSSVFEFNGRLSKYYDCIVSNPPFFSEQTYSPDIKRNMARNSSSLPFDVLMRNVSLILSSNGSFSVIVPYSEARSIIACGAECGLYLTRRITVSDAPGKPVKRALLSFSKFIKPTEESHIDIRNIDGQYSDAFRSLTDEFYVK
jgi:tRNA1Val (adenine37-N6)-methyltransferase